MTRHVFLWRLAGILAFLAVLALLQDSGAAGYLWLSAVVCVVAGVVIAPEVER